MKRARRYAIANRAGGIGKTTTAINLAAALVLSGLRVIIVDLDAQANASTAIGLRDVKHPNYPTTSVYDAFLDPELTPQAIGPSTVPNLDLVYGSPEMESVDLKLVMDSDPDMAIKARLMIDSIEALDRYDVIILDCPGAINAATRNALLAVDTVLMPVQTEFRAFEARGRLLTEISKLIAKKTMKKPPRILVFGNLFDERSRSARDIRDMLLEDVVGTVSIPDSLHVDALTRTVDGQTQLVVVHNAQHLADAYGLNRSIFDYAPTSRAAKEFIDLAAALEEYEASVTEATRG